MVETPTDKPPARWPWLVLVALYLGLRLPALLTYAPTYDEPIYLGASKHLLLLHETKPAAMLYHPPLAYHLTSIPLWFVNTPMLPWQEKGFGSQVGLEVLYSARTYGGDAPVSPQTILVVSRLPIVAFGLIGLWLCFTLGRRLAGDRCGWLAAAVWAVHPDVAAQSVQATTDLVAAVCALLVARTAIRHFDVAGARPDFAKTSHIALGAACGLAAIAKHTLLVPIAIVAVLSIVLRVRRSRARVEQPKRPVARFLAACAVGLVVVWGGYLLEFGPLAPDGAQEHAERLARWSGLDASTINRLLESVPVPAPTYWRSVADAFLDKARARGGTWVGYLDGTWDERGFLAYFPIALAVKTPTSMLVLMLAAVPAWWTVRRRCGYAADLCMLLFALPFAAAVASRLNIGVRHLLPAVPFLLCLGCAGLALLWESSPRFARIVTLLLAAGVGVEWAVNRLDPLPFANLPSGGPVHLHRRLADSNLEVGQDLWQVERWCEEHGVESAYVLLHDPQGLYEREVASHPYLLSREGMRHEEIVAAALATPQTGDVPRRGLLALGESVMRRPGYVQLAEVEPLARVGRTRIYRF